MKRIGVVSRTSRRLATLDRVFPVLIATFLIILILWALADRYQDEPSATYTTALFVGSAFGILAVVVLLATSRHLTMISRIEERARRKKAAVALVFDASGRLLLHFQPRSGVSSWPEHWLPPGGLIEGSLVETALARLKSLVCDQDWCGAHLIAATNNSAAYRRINKRAAQVPVQVNAYWFSWSASEPFIPKETEPDLPLDTKLVRADSIPIPTVPYYHELIEFIASLRTGTPNEAELQYWAVHDIGPLTQALRSLNGTD